MSSLTPASGTAAERHRRARGVVELERLAHTGELTGLANRRARLARLRADLGEGRTAGLPGR